MSTRTIRRNMRNMKKQQENEFYVDLVCAAIEEKKLYIPSPTAKRAKEGNKETIELIERYKRMYPEYQPTVNDFFFLKFVGVVPYADMCH